MQHGAIVHGKVILFEKVVALCVALKRIVDTDLLIDLFVFAAIHNKLSIFEFNFKPSEDRALCMKVGVFYSTFCT